MHSTDFDVLLKAAIRERRLVAFILNRRPRLAEPHDYGLVDREPRLFFYQIGGESRSGRAVGWRWAVLSKVSELRVLDEHFAGSRPALTGRHFKWDKLFATARLTPVAR